MLAQMVCPRPNGQYLVCKDGAPLTRAGGGGVGGQRLCFSRLPLLSSTEVPGSSVG